jgi:hypothetical protein
MPANAILSRLLETRLDAERARPWLQQQLAKLATEPRARDFYLAFSACSRFVPQEALAPTTAERTELEARYPNFSATEWTLDQLARVLLLTALPPAENVQWIDNLASTADYRELIALYQGLYWLDNASDFVPRAREGLRTNMVGVFDAIALDNPFPAAHLPEDAWNQMVLKAVFMERPIYRVYRIEERKNATLAAIFLDYAEERWSAHRAVTPELWRFVAGYADERFLPGIQKTIKEDEELQRLAATKALVESDFPAGQAWLKAEGIATGDLPDWNEIGRRWEKK